MCVGVSPVRERKKFRSLCLCPGLCCTWGSILGRKEKASCHQEQWRAGNVEWQIQMCSARQQAAVQETKSPLVLRAGRVGWGLGKANSLQSAFRIIGVRPLFKRAQAWPREPRQRWAELDSSLPRLPPEHLLGLLPWHPCMAEGRVRCLGHL